MKRLINACRNLKSCFIKVFSRFDWYNFGTPFWHLFKRYIWTNNSRVFSHALLIIFLLCWVPRGWFGHVSVLDGFRSRTQPGKLAYMCTRCKSYNRIIDERREAVFNCALRRKGRIFSSSQKELTVRLCVAFWFIPIII